MGNRKVEGMLEQSFVCAKCDHRGARVERLAMSGTGISRLMELQAHRYAFVSCQNCGFTEVYDLKTLAGADHLGTLLEIIFHD